VSVFTKEDGEVVRLADQTR